MFRTSQDTQKTTNIRFNQLSPINVHRQTQYHGVLFFNIFIKFYLPFNLCNSNRSCAWCILYVVLIYHYNLTQMWCRVPTSKSRQRAKSRRTFLVIRARIRTQFAPKFRHTADKKPDNYLAKFECKQKIYYCFNYQIFPLKFAHSRLLPVGLHIVLLSAAISLSSNDAFRCQEFLDWILRRILCHRRIGILMLCSGIL